MYLMSISAHLATGTLNYYEKYILQSISVEINPF